MANPTGPAPKVPASMLNERRNGWQAFTRFTVVNCVALALFLLLMLFFFKIV